MVGRGCLELRLFQGRAAVVAPGVEIGAMGGQILDDRIVTDTNGGVQGTGVSRRAASGRSPSRCPRRPGRCPARGGLDFTEAPGVPAAHPGENGTVLDHSMVVYGSSLSDSNAHTHDNVPTLLAGGGSGAFKGGRHQRYPDGTPMTNLFLTMFDRLGVQRDQVGDSTGQISHLSV